MQLSNFFDSDLIHKIAPPQDKNKRDARDRKIWLMQAYTENPYRLQIFIQTIRKMLDAAVQRLRSTRSPVNYS
jgi:hypothetical protein